MAKATVEAVGTDTLVFNFSTGEALEASLSHLSPDIVHRLAMHGLEQKIRDSYAGAEAEEAPGLARKVWDNLTSGVWTSRPAGTGKGSILYRALVAIFEEDGKPVPENLKDMVEGLSKGDKIRLRRDPRVAQKIAQLQPKGESILEQLFD